MTVDDVPLSAPQVSTWNTVYASAKEANGGEEDDRTMKIALDAWRVMYSKSDGSWKRRETAKTTRGYSFPLRPEESSKVDEHGSSGRFILEDGKTNEGGKTMSRRKVAERMFERASVRFVPLPSDTEEPLPEGVIMRVDGILGEVDKVNRNGRIYPRSLIEKELKRVGQSMLDREVFVLADHPTMGEPFTGSVGKVAGIVVSATLAEEPDHKIYGTIDIVDNQAGRDVAAIVRAGAKIGVSQRGIGSMEEGDIVDFEGRSRTANVVQNDYRLESWDIVIGPSADAHVTSFRESEEETMSLDSTEKVRTENPELIEDIKAEVATDVREEVSEEVTAKLEAEFDEKVARAVEARLAAEAEAGNEAKIEEARVALESRISELEAESASTKAELEESQKNLSEFSARVEKANGLRNLLRDKLSSNPRLYVRVESVIFSESGEAQVEEDALDRIVGDAISSVSQPGPDAPPSGSGVVDIEEEKAVDTDRLDRINSMRTLAGLPTLESIPTN